MSSATTAAPARCSQPAMVRQPPADPVTRDAADAYLRSGDPGHLAWKPNGILRNARRFGLWARIEAEETRLTYSPFKGWHIARRWVRA